MVATGTNADDARAGFRPGIAAAAERGAITPLLDAGFTKAQIREASRRWELATWDKPAAACLSSRVAFGVTISAERLARIERAEAAARAAFSGNPRACQNALFCSRLKSRSDVSIASIASGCSESTKSIWNIIN